MVEFDIFIVNQASVFGFLVRLRSDTLGNRHGTDPYAWWCGREGDKNPLPIPLGLQLHNSSLIIGPGFPQAPGSRCAEETTA